MRSLILHLFNLGAMMASTTTAPPSVESALTFRNPLMDEITLKFASVNGTTTIWAAGYTAPPGRSYVTADGTVQMLEQILFGTKLVSGIHQLAHLLAKPTLRRKLWSEHLEVRMVCRL